MMLEALKAFAAEEAPQKEATNDGFTLDEVTFKRIFRQIYNVAERYKDVQDAQNETYWASMATDICALSKDWQLRDADGNVIIDPTTGGCKFHPLFFRLASAILDAYSDIERARRKE